MTKTTHSLRRTSPKGQDFIGSCVLCGEDGLTFNDASKYCDNLRGLSKDEIILEAVTGEVQ